MIKGLVADIHFHAWSAFATTDSNGFNSRLNTLLFELETAGMAVMRAGGKHLVIAGDVFHQRGSVAPSVLNPVVDTMKRMIDTGLNIIIIPGNHDEERKETARISSAITTLENIGVTVVHHPWQIYDMFVVPWVENLDELKRIISANANKDLDLILHAPINGVIPGLPDHGLDPEWLAKQGYYRVFSGHYHNHKVFPGGVYSIGALAHHSWSDVGSKAGHLIVDEVKVTYCKSHAPSFNDIRDDVLPEDLPDLCDGNFVRVHTQCDKNSELEAMRKSLMNDFKAKAVVFHAMKKVVSARGAATVKAGSSIELSLTDFIGAGTFAGDKSALNNLCQKLLTEARA